MTDRELLELAAKACGYWDAEYNCVDRIPHLGWNPPLGPVFKVTRL